MSSIRHASAAGINARLTQDNAVTIFIVYAFTLLSLISVSSPSVADYFLGLDYTSSNSELTYPNTYSTHYMNPIRLRAGYKSWRTGIEFDLLSQSDDDNTNGSVNFEMGPAGGVYFYMHESWWHIKLGGIWSKTKLTNNATGESASPTLFQYSGAVGAAFELNKQFAIIADYTYSKGSADYSSAGLDMGKSDVTTKSLALGVTYSF